MRRDSLGPLAGIFAPALIVAAAVLCAAAQAQQKTPEPGQAVVCRVLEAKVVEKLGVTLVLFHQAQRSDAARLGQLLRQNDGAAVEFETSDGRSNAATVVRLGTCFGRGLLVFPAGSAHLAKQEQFWLRFPEVKSRPANP